MSNRIYFLLPDSKSCKAVVEDLLQSGVKEKHIHVVGNRFTPLEGMKQASSLQTSELKHGVELGLSVGGAAGLLGGLLAVSFPPAGVVLGGGALLAAALAGAGGAALVSALIAKDIPNHKLQAFQDAVSAGQLLLLVDVSRHHLDAVLQIVRRHRPEAEIYMSEASAHNAKPD